MAIESNSSKEQVVSVPKFYDGIGNFRVLAVNPTVEQMAKIGIELKNEVQYTNIEMQGDLKNKIVFIVSNEKHKIITRVEFVVSPNTRSSASSSKIQFINEYGNTAWADSLEDIKDNEKMAWFNTETAREAYEGEEKLINFIRAWANVGNEGKVFLDNPDKVFNGDVSELRNLVTRLKSNEVRLLLGVQDKGDRQYQKVYDKFFGRPYAKDSGFVRSLNSGEYGKFDALYDPTNFTLKEFDPVSLASSANAGTASDASEEDYYG